MSTVFLSILTLLSFVNARATLDKSGHLMLITYDIQGLNRSEAITEIDTRVYVKERTYRLATSRYPNQPLPFTIPPNGIGDKVQQFQSHSLANVRKFKIYETWGGTQ